MPSWFPGAGFKRQAAEWRGVADRVVNIPYDDYLRREVRVVVDFPSLRIRLSSCRLGIEDGEG